MPLGRRHNGGVAGQIILVVTLIVTAEDKLVELKPVLNRMTGSTQADDRLARLNILLHLIKLFTRELHAACENNYEIRLDKRVEARKAVFLLANDHGAAIAVLLPKPFGKAR